MTLLLCFSLAACSGYGSRPYYFGHEASTEGMPGVVNGQKISPNVKLGKPYMVDGHTYYPHYDPHFVEEGLASWYGPGFHGGKTANGEVYSKYDYTAAHPTLPMPSIVKVTNLKNGKVVYVRINDRGPYAHGRIIDLSRSAAEQIDLVRMGLAKVRIEYMQAESERFVELLAQGRTPSSIDIATEVVGQTGNELAGAPGDHSHWWEFAPNANAQESGPNTAPVSDGGGDMQVNDLPAPGAQAPMTMTSPQAIVPGQPVTAVTVDGELPSQAPLFSDTNVPPADEASAPVPTGVLPSDAMPAQEPVARPAANIAPAPVGGYYVQLGSFSVESNALAMQSRFTSLASSTVEPGHNASGAPVYRVRIGPFGAEAQASNVLQRAQSMGAADAKLIKQ